MADSEIIAVLILLMAVIAFVLCLCVTTARHERDYWKTAHDALSKELTSEKAYGEQLEKLISKHESKNGANNPSGN